MSECAMTMQLALDFSLRALVDAHPVVSRVLVLAVIFMSGYLDVALLGRRDLACVTWFGGLVALTGWIAYPWSPARIVGGALVFLIGIVSMVVYCRRRVRRT